MLYIRFHTVTLLCWLRLPSDAYSALQSPRDLYFPHRRPHCSPLSCSVITPSWCCLSHFDPLVDSQKCPALSCFRAFLLEVLSSWSTFSQILTGLSSHHIIIVLWWFSLVQLLQPHGLQPARLLCPWDSPGKNTGEGYHFLLQRIFLPRDWTRIEPGSPALQADSYWLSYEGSQI